MNNKTISIQYAVYAYDELPTEYRELVDRAKAATEHSYAPYSKFNVGAAILLENGEVVAANNQENAAYPSGLCAERVAMFYANATHPNVAPRAMVIAARTKGDFLDEPISPCGACRQVLLETEARFGQKIEILLYGKKAIYRISSIRDLLPFAFDQESL